jgi:hypothetical protein
MVSILNLIYGFLPDYQVIPMYLFDILSGLTMYLVFWYLAKGYRHEDSRPTFSGFVKLFFG